MTQSKTQVTLDHSCIVCSRIRDPTVSCDRVDPQSQYDYFIAEVVLLLLRGFVSRRAFTRCIGMGPCTIVLEWSYQWPISPPL